MNHMFTEVFSTMQAMKAQLRQDYMYILVNSLPMEKSTREAVNTSHHFSFPEGIFCMFVLGATPKLHTVPLERQWLEAADAHIHKTFSDLPGDFETRIQGCKIYCLMGTTLTKEETTSRIQKMFSNLLEDSNTYGCYFTLGLGHYVEQISDLPQTLVSAQHALKYSIRDGIRQFYDGNRSCVIYEGGLTMLTPSEQISLKRLIQKPKDQAIREGILRLFQSKQSEINRYPVFAYMLSLHVLSVTIQTLRELMPVDRQTYELFQEKEGLIDDIFVLDALLEHTIASTQALCHRYQLYLTNGKSHPIWLAITYIQEHYTENITLEELSRVADRNPQYLSAVFSKTCGMSLKEYITALRIKDAKNYLRSTGMPIGEIATKLGYQDAKYFSRVFQRLIGKSPRDYRNASTAE